MVLNEKSLLQLVFMWNETFIYFFSKLHLIFGSNCFSSQLLRFSCVVSKYCIIYIVPKHFLWNTELIEILYLHIYLFIYCTMYYGLYSYMNHFSSGHCMGTAELFIFIFVHCILKSFMKLLKLLFRFPDKFIRF